MSSVIPIQPREDAPGRPNVVIDGIAYAPAPPQGLQDAYGRPIMPPARIGIGITTRNRNAQLAKTLAEHERYLPPGAKVVVVDDASDTPALQGSARFEVTHRFESNVGIARAKNKCLELLGDQDHIFLFDDDVYPLADGWWLPYIESPEPHLMYQFLDLAGRHKLRDLTELYRDDQHVALSGPRGPMLYVERRVLDIVGGMDPAFGKFGYEHGDWSNRIHHAGLTTWRYADVIASDKLIYSMDEHVDEIPGGHVRSVPVAERRVSVERNKVLHDQRVAERSAAYVEYRETRCIVMTSLFAGKPDPQRPRAPRLTAQSAQALLTSLKDEDVVVTTDVTGFPERARLEVVEHSVRVSPYIERHLAHLAYLRAHPEVDKAFLVDATDVEMLGSPWAEMKPGTLYVGYEPTVVATPWMTKNFPKLLTPAFLAEHGMKPLLNVGVMGGDRQTLIEVLQAMVTLHFDDPEASAEMDMGLLNVVAYDRLEGRVFTGPRVVTTFRANERNTVSWFKHK